MKKSKQNLTKPIALTIDFEDWYHSLFDVDPQDWAQYESRIEITGNLLLNLLQEHKVKATFFILGIVADEHPQLVQRIYNDGHEIACHGYAHRLLTTMSPDEFRKDLQKATSSIEIATGVRPSLYRAPVFSLTKKNSMGTTYSSYRKIHHRF